MDARGLDVVVSASQKCLMMPPGAAFIALSERAQTYMEQSEASRYYFDLRRYQQFWKKVKRPLRPIFILSSPWRKP